MVSCSATDSGQEVSTHESSLTDIDGCGSPQSRAGGNERTNQSKVEQHISRKGWLGMREFAVFFRRKSEVFVRQLYGIGSDTYAPRRPKAHSYDGTVWNGTCESGAAVGVNPPVLRNDRDSSNPKSPGA